MLAWCTLVYERSLSAGQLDYLLGVVSRGCSSVVCPLVVQWVVGSIPPRGPIELLALCMVSFELGTRHGSVVEHLLMVQWVLDQSLLVDTLSYFLSLCKNSLQLRTRHGAVVEHLLMVQWVLDQSLLVDTLSYFLSLCKNSLQLGARHGSVVEHLLMVGWVRSVSPGGHRERFFVSSSAPQLV